jgi:hypothetical protein
LRVSARGSCEYKEMMTRVEEIRSVDCGQLDERKKKSKRRKILKGLKQYTVKQGNEKAFRGPSARAYTDMAMFKREIITEATVRYGKFGEMAHKHLYALTRRGANGTDEDLVTALVSDLTYNELFDFKAV